MLRALTSLRTTLLLVALLLLLAGYGSFAIQLSPEAYASIERGILLRWLLGEATLGAGWWIWAMIAATALLAVNACVCVAVSLARSVRRRALPWRGLWAHLAHAGFLLVLAGHLIGSVWGFRSDGHPAFAGRSFSVPQRPGWTVSVGALDVAFAPEGYPSKLAASLTVRSGPKTLAEGTAEINRPVFAERAAVYLKEVRPALRGWAFRGRDGASVTAEVGVPLPLPGGSLVLADWSQAPDGRIGVRLLWAPAGGPSSEGWFSPAPGDTLALPSGPTLRWGEMAVDELGIFDVRYDPGAPLALLGGMLLSVSLVPLLRPRSAGRLSGSYSSPRPPRPEAHSLGEMAAP